MGTITTYIYRYGMVCENKNRKTKNGSHWVHRIKKNFKKKNEEIPQIVNSNVCACAIMIDGSRWSPFNLLSILPVVDVYNVIYLYQPYFCHLSLYVFGLFSRFVSFSLFHSLFHSFCKWTFVRISVFDCSGMGHCWLLLIFKRIFYGHRP